MSVSTVEHKFFVGGVSVDPTSVILRDKTDTFGVLRTDTSAVVVASGTPMVDVGDDWYSYSWTDPADGLTFKYVVEVVYNGTTNRYTYFKDGGTDSVQNLFSLSPLVEPYLKACPLEIIKQQLSMALWDWCRQTHSWKQELAAIASVEDQADYQMVVSYNAIILVVRGVTTDGDDVIVSEVSETEILTLETIPSEDDLDIVPTVTLGASETCDAVPAWLLNRWGRAIADGALEFLLAMKNKPWGDPQMASYYANKYRRSILEAKNEGTRKRKAGSIPWQGRRFV